MDTPSTAIEQRMRRVLIDAGHLVFIDTNLHADSGPFKVVSDTFGCIVQSRTSHYIASGGKWVCEPTCEKLNLLYAEWLMIKPDSTWTNHCPHCFINFIQSLQHGSACPDCGEPL